MQRTCICKNGIKVPDGTELQVYLVLKESRNWEKCLENDENCDELKPHNKILEI